MPEDGCSSNEDDWVIRDIGMRGYGVYYSVFISLRVISQCLCWVVVLGVGPRLVGLP